MVNRRNLLKLSALGTASFAAPHAYSASKITMAYNTGNAPGSKDPRDLIDNSEDLDLLMTAEADYEPNRLGAPLKSWKGMEREHDSAQARRESEFDVDQAERVVEFSQFLESSGFEIPVDYVAGLEITRPTQVIRFGGELYRAKDASLPFTTTTWAADSPKLFSMGDAALRQEIAEEEGASLIGYKRSALSSAITTAKQMLDGQAVNIWEHAGAITYKPSADPKTWDWTPALVAANTWIKTLGATGAGTVVYPPGQYPHTRMIRENSISLLGSGSGSCFITALPFAPGGTFGMVEIASGIITGAHMKGFHILGSANAAFGAPPVNPTQWGMYIKATWNASYTGGGLWMSLHEDLRFSNFNFGLWSRAGYTNNHFLRPNQWLEFRHCFLQMPTGGEALRMTGQHGQIKWVGGAAEGRDSAVALRCITLDYDPDPATMADNASGHGESTADVAGVGAAIQTPISPIFDGISLQKSQEGVFARISKGAEFRSPYVENIGKFATLTSTAQIHLDGGRWANAADGSLFGSAGNGYLYSLSGNATLTFGEKSTKSGSIDNEFDPLMNLNNINGIQVKGGVSLGTAGKFKAAAFKALALTTSTVDVSAHRFAILNSGADRSVKLTTLNSTAAPGETVYLRPSAGPITVAIGGNISLNGLSELTIPANGVLALLRIPQVGGSGEWVLQSSPEHTGTSEPSNGYYYASGTRIWRSNPAIGSFAGWTVTTAGLAGSTAVFGKMPNISA